MKTFKDFLHQVLKNLIYIGIISMPYSMLLSLILIGLMHLINMVIISIIMICVGIIGLYFMFKFYDKIKSYIFNFYDKYFS